MINKIGFIGQGWLGKNYADWYENNTDFEVVRYDQTKHNGNRDKIKECDLVFICVPTPTTPYGFDDSTLEEVLALVGDFKIALIKSTCLPGTTEKMQKMYPDKHILFVPEFLTEATAQFDVANPTRNIIGITMKSHDEIAKKVMDILPRAKYEIICTAREAEIIKYAGNNWFYFKVIYMNLLYDWCQVHKVDYNLVTQAMVHDFRVGSSHMDAVHGGGRGAGGHCFIKDMEAFAQNYAELVRDPIGNNLLDALITKNLHLLKDSKKSLNLIEQIYGN